MYRILIVFGREDVCICDSNCVVLVAGMFALSFWALCSRMVSGMSGSKWTSTHSIEDDKEITSCRLRFRLTVL